MATGVPYRLDLQPLDERKTIYELRLQEVLDEQGAGVSANIREVGFGITQMLPIIAQAVLAKPGNTLIIEQPELHLHPRAQAELGDMFIAMTRSSTNFLIETHSEHLLLRFRRRIAESSSAMISQDDLGYLKADDLRAYFVDRTEGHSRVKGIEADEIGKMSSPPGFRGFFADDLHELAMLNRAILKMPTDEG